MRIQNVSELGVLGQKTITGMNGVRAGDFAGGDDLVDIQITVTRRRWSDADAFVRKAHMHRVGICCRMHGNRFYAKLTAGTKNTKGDFAAIGNQDLLEHSGDPLFIR